LFKYPKKAVTGYPGCYVLSDNHKVILNFIHSQLSNAGHRLGTVSLRDIYDLYCFSKRVALQQIAAPYRQKYLAYCDITNKLLGLPIFDMQTLTSKVFCRKHDLNLNSTLFFAINRIPWVISTVALIGYPKQIKEAINYKDARLFLFQKLGSRKWYVHHLLVYKKLIIKS